MPFSAADYQNMAQGRKRRRNNGQQAASQAPVSAAQNAQDAQNAGRSSSRQGTAALNRARPGVPAMPVQGLDVTKQEPDTTKQELDTTKQEPDTTKQEQPAGVAGMPASIRNMANAGAMAGAGVPAGGIMPAQSSDPSQVGGPGAGSSMGLLGGAGGGYSGLMGGVATKPTQTLAGMGGAFGAGAGGAPEVAPGMEDFRLAGQGKGAIHDEMRDAQTGEYQNLGGGLIGGQGGLTGVQEEDIGTGTSASDEYFDRLEEERAMYEQYMADLEAERGESQGLIARGISEQQRRQAEMNALAGRSVGGGFGGAMATTSAMGAAAMEEADRAIRGKMREAQLGWLDKVSSLNESQRGRDFAEQMSDEDKAHALDIASIDAGQGIPLDGDEEDWREHYGDGAGGTGTAGAGDGAGLPGNAGAGGSSGTGESFDPNDASGQALYREGWRPTPSGDWKNDAGQTWSEVYPDSAEPENSSMQDYQSSIGSSGDDSVMNNEAYAADPESLTTEQKQHMLSLGTVEEREEYLKSIGPMSEWYNGNMSFEDAVSQMHEALRDEGSAWEDVYEQMADEVFWDETTYSDENGNTVRGDQLKDLINNMADAAGWNEAELSLGDTGEHQGGTGFFGTYDEDYYEETYGSTNVNDDPDKRYLWVMSQPGLLREITNRALYYMDQSGSTPQWGSTDFANEILAELQESGLLDPGR